MTFFIEAVGSPVWGSHLPWLKATGACIVGADITGIASGLYLVDKPYIVPRYRDSDCWSKLKQICQEAKVTVVLPSINEGLMGWASREDEFSDIGVSLILSPVQTIEWCADKWLTYEHFKRNDIPTPRTSLINDYELVKPRNGRGGAGIYRIKAGVDTLPDGCVTQEIMHGVEYSIDALCGKDGSVRNVVIRQRTLVESGVSICGVVIDDPEIESLARRILDSSPFFGPVNLQCFRTERGVFFIEVNPRVPGGLSLSMAATENWFLTMAAWLENRDPGPPPKIKHGMTMMRHYSDVFISKDKLL
jgi:carbamoyl-phosphate synthase large subunit